MREPQTPLRAARPPARRAALRRARYWLAPAAPGSAGRCAAPARPGDRRCGAQSRRRNEAWTPWPAKAWTPWPAKAWMPQPAKAWTPQPAKAWTPLQQRWRPPNQRWPAVPGRPGRRWSRRCHQAAESCGRNVARCEFAACPRGPARDRPPGPRPGGQRPRSGERADDPCGAELRSTACADLTQRDCPNRRPSRSARHRTGPADLAPGPQRAPIPASTEPAIPATAVAPALCQSERARSSLIEPRQ